MNRLSAIASDEVRVSVFPTDTYHELLARGTEVTWVRALRRPAFVILLVATTVSIAATGRVTIALVASSALSWSFAVVLQAAVGAIVSASAPRRQVSMPRALDLWFAGHLPWSLWLLAVAAITRTAPSLPVEAFLLTMVGPIAWTSVISSAYSRTVLGATRRGSLLRSAAHQVVTLVMILSFVAWSAGGWFRLLS